MTITRFAPSPTGFLHLGHAYAAKVAYEKAKQNGGTFLLRFEDIDHTRVRPEYYEAIEEDLRWLGFPWDGIPVKQIDRSNLYEEAFTKLKGLDILYPCYCTRREIWNAANAPQGSPAPLYPGTCREGGIPKGEPSWRLDTKKAAALTGPLTFNEEIEVDPHLLGDVVLARRDIATSYHLAVVVDDAAQGITHVTRGEDLLSSTHIHRTLQALLELPEPSYVHHPLICDALGERLAKRNDSLSIRELRNQGKTRAEVLAMCSPNQT